jgi:hypothetical protein
MITKKDNYAEWALLLYELEDAKEHLETLMQEMADDPEFDEVDYRIGLGHIYTHLNRAWNARNRLGTTRLRNGMKNSVSSLKILSQPSAP